MSKTQPHQIPTNLDIYSRQVQIKPGGPQSLLTHQDYRVSFHHLFSCTKIFSHFPCSQTHIHNTTQPQASASCFSRENLHRKTSKKSACKRQFGPHCTFCCFIQTRSQSQTIIAIHSVNFSVKVLIVKFVWIHTENM